MTVENLIAHHRRSIVQRATVTTSLATLEDWFYSAFWDDLPTSELGRVHKLLVTDREIATALGAACAPVVSEDEHRTEQN